MSATPESGRMKRRRALKDPRVPPSIPAFLGAHAAEGGSREVHTPRSQAYKPAWGFRNTDSVIASTQHAADWSKNCIAPPDYRDMVSAGGIEEAELLGSQSMYSVSRL